MSGAPGPGVGGSGVGGGWGEHEQPVRVRVPADLDTQDRIVFGLTLRQILVIAVFAVPVYLLWQMLLTRVPVPVLAAFTAPPAALALGIAVGRRDGLSLDAWLIAALRHARAPRALSVTARHDPGTHPPKLGVLRLPAVAISPDGIITLPTPSTSASRMSPVSSLLSSTVGGPGAAALVAVRTVTAGLHTPTEQATVLTGVARWLNGLTAPVHVVLSSQPVDLPARAARIARAAHTLHTTHDSQIDENPLTAVSSVTGRGLLARAAFEYAQHLLDLGEQSHPRARTVTIACTTTAPTAAATPNPRGGGRRGSSTGRGAGRSAAGLEVRRRAEQTAAALAGLGAQCRILDGADVTAVLAAACDPFGPAGTWARTPPGQPVTGPPIPPDPPQARDNHSTGEFDATKRWTS